MRKLIAAMKVSLDGKVEGSEGYADWVPAWSEDFGLTTEIDACVLGGGMYGNYELYWTNIQNAPDEPNPMGAGLPSPGEVDWARFAAATPHYVISTTIHEAQWSNTRFLHSLDELVALKEQPGRSIYLMGGARILASCLDAGLVDELRLIVYPIIAGDGTPLFTAPSRRELRLRETHRLDGGLVRLDYAFR